MRTTSSGRRKHASVVIGGIAVVSLFVSSCSSDSDSDSKTTTAPVETTASSGTAGSETTAAVETTAASSDTSGSETTAAAETTAPAADPLGTPNAASGDPIVIGTINEGGSGALDQQSANTLTGIEIAAQYANDYLGGIAGHPIKIESCGSKATPAGATDCANQMVEKKVNAYIMPYSGQEAPIVNVLTAAGIPMVVGSASSQEGLTSPGVFALTGGYPATLGAFAIDAKQNGVKKFVMLVVDVPAATGGASALGGITFGKEGVPFEVVPVAVGTADMTPMVQAAVSGGADALGVTGDATFCTSFLQAYKTLGLSTTKYVISTCLDPAVVAAAGDVLDGSRVATTRAAGPDDAIFAATVAKYGDGSSDATPNGGIGDGWGNMMGLVNLLNGYTGDIDNASLLAAIKAAKPAPIPLSGGLTFTCDGTAIPILANVCSGAMQMAVVDDKGGLSDFTPVDAGEAYAS